MLLILFQLAWVGLWGSWVLSELPGLFAQWQIREVYDACLRWDWGL